MLPRVAENASLALVAAVVCHAGPSVGSRGLVISSAYADVAEPLTIEISSKQAQSSGEKRDPLHKEPPGPAGLCTPERFSEDCQREAVSMHLGRGLKTG